MISTIIHISFMRLWHNKAELLLTFIVPILFFSIFAWIFGSRGSAGTTPQLKVVACDEIGSAVTERTRVLLEESKSLRFHITSKDSAVPSNPVSRATAESLVRRGLVSAAIIFSKPKNIDSINQQLSKSDGTSLGPEIEIFADSFDQVASQVVVAFVQKASMTAKAEHSSKLAMEAAAQRKRFAPNSVGSVEKSQVGAPVTGAMSIDIPGGSSATVNAVALSETEAALASQNGLDSSGLVPAVSLPTIEVVDVIGSNKSNPVVAMYAAGIAVMFLLFSATTASGAILEERENSTLERLLCSRMTMDHLLMGKWCYLVLIGCLQTTLMFTAGALFFGLNLMGHLGGFAVMTFVTASAAASFALMMAAMCKTRTQLGWVSTILILSMSALGGSMVPRYLMSETIQRVGQVTFNAWALDGYNKIFWRELPVNELTRELSVLVTCAFVFMVLARILATRWDRA